MAKFKELQLGQKVRVLGVAKSSADLGAVPESTIGDVATITQINDRLKKWVRLDNDWAYKAKDLEIVSEGVSEPVVEQPVLTTESNTSKVDASTPIGTKVRVLRDQEDGYYKAGAVGTLGWHDGDDRPRIDFLDDYWYPNYANLEIVPQDTPDTVCKPELEPEPVAAPKELTLEDFVFTRVRVKEGGAKGTVIGHTPTGGIGVQHDVGSTQGWKHECSAILGDAQGAEARCYWYGVEELEIINEEV